MVIPIAVLVVVLGFVTYGAFSIGSSPLTEAKVPMSIFGTASGLLSVIGFLPDTFVHTWFGGLIDAQGADAFNTIFIALVVFAVLGCFCLVMTRRAMKKNAARRSPPTSVYLPTPAVQARRPQGGALEDRGRDMNKIDVLSKINEGMRAVFRQRKTSSQETPTTRAPASSRCA